jgi:hypothetical protein
MNNMRRKEPDMIEWLEKREEMSRTRSKFIYTGFCMMAVPGGKK